MASAYLVQEQPTNRSKAARGTIVALALLLVGSFFVLGSGPGTLVWLAGKPPAWLPFAGSGLNWLPFVSGTDNVPGQQASPQPRSSPVPAGVPGSTPSANPSPSPSPSPSPLPSATPVPAQPAVSPVTTPAPASASAPPPTPTPTPNPTAVPTPAPLSMSVSGSPSSGIAPLAVSFAATTTGGTSPVSYAWDFGDGTTSIQPNPAHTYTAPGTYTATVNVTDAAGGTDMCTVVVTVWPALVVTAAAAPTIGAAPLLVSFTGSASGGAGGPYSYYWDFGDGTMTTGVPASHTYAAGGNFVVTFEAYDSAGNSASFSIGVSPLSVGISATPTTGPFPLNVAFTANPAGGSGTYAGYSWTFGDGATSTSTGATASHTYTAPGTYTATVVLTDSNTTAVTSAGEVITVTIPPLTLTARASPSSALAPLTTTLTGTAGGGFPALTYGWDFGDGTTPVTGLTSPTTSHSYPVPGKFTATLKVTDSAVPADVTTATVAITAEAPVPQIGSVSPPFGPETGGTAVVITGTWFENASAVKFGSHAATFAAPVCDGVGNCSLTATSPAAAAGAVNVTVTTPGGTTAAVNDQFTYDLAWTATTASGPSAREGATAANDGTRVVLFGGTSGLLDLGDTWTWNGTAWTPAATPLGLGARAYAGSAYDSTNHVVVLFGGNCQLLILGCADNDTWTWSPTTQTWTQAQANSLLAPGPNQPSKRYGAMLAYDSTLNQVIMFGGFDGTNYLNDTWGFNFNATTNTGTWTLLRSGSCGSGSRPACRAYGALGRDTSGQVVLFGGASATGALGDTWTWNGSSWTQYGLSSPPARQMASMAAYNQPGGGTGAGLVLFGGANGTTAYGDTWTWTGGRWTQTYAAGAAGEPSARYGAAMATDTSGGLVVFGGNSGTALYGDTSILK